MLGEIIGMAMFGESFCMDMFGSFGMAIFIVRAQSFGMAMFGESFGILCLVRASICYVR